MTIQIIPKSFFLMISLTLLFIAGCDDSEDKKKKSKANNLNNEASGIGGSESIAFTLNPKGISHLMNPFLDFENWVYTCGREVGGLKSTLCNESSGFVKHYRDDYYAQDWAKKGGNEATCWQEIRSPIKGKVIFADWRINEFLNEPDTLGKQVVIHSSVDLKFAIKIAHLNEISVVQGQEVKIGEPIGKVGNTGMKKQKDGDPEPSCHAHIVLYKNLNDSNLKNGLKLIGGANGGDATSIAAEFKLDATYSTLVTSTTTTSTSTNITSSSIATSTSTNVVSSTITTTTTTTTLPSQINYTVSPHQDWVCNSSDNNIENDAANLCIFVRKISNTNFEITISKFEGSFNNDYYIRLYILGGTALKFSNGFTQLSGSAGDTMPTVFFNPNGADNTREVSNGDRIYIRIESPQGKGAYYKTGSVQIFK